MVPESATAIISGDLADLDSKLVDFTAAYGIKADAETLENGQVQVTVIGKSAHGSTPEEGVNGATYLAKFLSQFAFDEAAKAYLIWQVKSFWKTMTLKTRRSHLR